MRNWLERLRSKNVPSVAPNITLDQVVQRRFTQIAAASFFFVQIGAFDGISNDPIYPFVQQYGWRGVLLEPQQDAFATLKANYANQPQLTLINAALADRDGVHDFYRVRDDVAGLPSWSRQIGSFNLDHLLKHAHGIPEYGITETIPNIAELIRTEPVRCITFNTLLDEVGVEHVDLLQIDAEGYDADIVRMIPFRRVKPHIIRYEHMHLSRAQQAACIRHLARQGYALGLDYADTIAYRK